MFVGLMSGTSMDGVDGVLVRFGDRSDSPPLVVLAHAHRAFPADLASQLLSLNACGVDELHRSALAGNALARLYATVVTDLLTAADVPCTIGRLRSAPTGRPFATARVSSMRPATRCKSTTRHCWPN